MKQMSGLIMALVFLGVPLLIALALPIRRGLWALQRRFDRAGPPPGE